MATEHLEKHWADVARRFGQEVVAPRTRELDAEVDPEASFSWDIVEEASRRGLRTMTLSEEWGGGGAGCLVTAKVVEEIARFDLGVSVVMAQTWKLIQTLEAATTAHQRDRYLRVVRDDPRCLLAIGFTEPDVASDYIAPYERASFKTEAQSVDGGWKLTGKKHFVSNANRAMVFIIFAQTDPSKSLLEGSTAFLLQRGVPGFSTGRVHNKLGERLANNAELLFDDCFIPDSDVLGEVNGGFGVQSRFFPASNAYAAASILGVGQTAYDRALAWAQTRVQGGRPLLSHDSVAIDLAHMRMELEAARTYVHRAARGADGTMAWVPTHGSLPKVFASQVAWRVVTQALELHGGRGYMKDESNGMEKLIRDAAAFLHSDGASRTLLLKAAKAIRAEVAEQ
ncbi:MAG: acyl-CoA dehydrogenase family protein [Actinomycetota bacterium]|nr:acyl-CoA dehydrogenase family protein [Actinomycetota bacterium]